MSLNVAIDHSVARNLLISTEKSEGQIGVYKIELRADLEQRGFAELPSGPVTAHLVKVDGAEKFMYTNMMDDYCRCTTVDRDDLRAEPVFLRAETPHADEEAKRVSREQDRAREIALAAEHRAQLDAQASSTKGRAYATVNALAKLLGMDQLANQPSNDSRASALSERIERLKTLSPLSSIPQPVLKSTDFDSRAVGTFLSHGFYRAVGAHDVSLTIEQKGDVPEKALIEFKDLSGKTLASAVVGFVELETRYADVFDNYTDYDSDHSSSDIYVSHTLDLDGESDVQPVFLENGRPTLLKNSHFQEAYKALASVEMVGESNTFMHPKVREVSAGNNAELARDLLLPKRELLQRISADVVQARGRKADFDQGLSA
ncbi:hypothetical protein RYA05_00720 [Pseudomonas syringae pv. actinidiae]|nr:hypothetical protein [Pseudomonas syringae pv. actinidiae]